MKFGMNIMASVTSPPSYFLIRLH